MSFVTYASLLWLTIAAGEREVPGFGAFERELPYRAEFLGSEKCGSCHVEHYRWQKDHHMALTGRAVTEGTRNVWFSQEHLTKPIDAGGTELAYQVETRGVFLVGPNGRVSVAAVFGSGARGFTPIGIEAGRAIREMRLSFSTTDNAWIATPGTEGDPDPLGTPKSAEQSRDCLSCHATLLAWKGGQLDAGSSVFGVGCERCHGPGSAHVKAVKRKARTKEEDDSLIWTPRALPADEQVAFCGQCHRTPSDFEPLDVLMRKPLLARHAGASLMLSRCFRESPPEKTVTCLDCHNPHENVGRSSDRFQKACLGCHSSPERDHRTPITSSSNCISCHMPVKEKAFHGVRFTDHWIRVPGSPAPLSSIEKDEYLLYLEKSYAKVAERAALGPERKARILVDLGEVLFVRGELESAFRRLKEGLSYSPRYQYRLKAAAMFRQAGRLDDALSVLEDAIRAEPSLAQAYYEQGEALQEAGNPDGAARRYSQAIEREPKFPGAHNSLGSVAAAEGQLDQAVEHFKTAIALKPDYALAHTNLGIALLMTKRSAEGLLELEEAVRLMPELPFALNALARVRASHPDESVRKPTEAVLLADRAAIVTDRRDAVILDTLAAAWASAGRFDKAVAVAEEALGLAAPKLAEEIRGRLELYRRNQPYVEKREP